MLDLVICTLVVHVDKEEEEGIEKGWRMRAIIHVPPKCFKFLLARFVSGLREIALGGFVLCFTRSGSSTMHKLRMLFLAPNYLIKGELRL